MAYSRTSTTTIQHVILCSHCGEVAKEVLGHPHKNEEDEYYCECPNAKKEKDIKDKQSYLRNQVFMLEREVEELLRESEPTLNQKMYEIESENLKRKYKMK